jgi:hypothetical protein
MKGYDLISQKKRSFVWTQCRHESSGFAKFDSIDSIARFMGGIFRGFS